MSKDKRQSEWTTMAVRWANVDALGVIRDRLGLKSVDAALTHVLSVAPPIAELKAVPHDGD